MSQLFYLITQQDRRLERYERAELRREGSRARSARIRRQLSEEKWR